MTQQHTSRPAEEPRKDVRKSRRKRRTCIDFLAQDLGSARIILAGGFSMDLVAMNLSSGPMFQEKDPEVNVTLKD